MRIALVSRELDPLCGGGIGVFATALAGVLAAEPGVEVTLFTSSELAPAHSRAIAAGWKAPAPIVFVAVPGDDPPPGYHGAGHCFSDRVFRALLERYPGGGPDLVEFADFLGDGAVTIQARCTGHPGVRRARVCVGLHTTAEIVDVLNGYVDLGANQQVRYDLERFSLRFADAILHPGGDVLETYRRFYGAAALAPAHLRRHPPAALGGVDSGRSGRGLSLIYAGRLERRKGVLDLLRAVTALPGDDWTLTLVGADTSTGPLGTSVRELLELEAGADARIRIVGPVPRAEVAALLGSASACVVPSRWECWPNVVLESLAAGVPVIATPVGGMIEQVEHGETGLLARATGPGPLGDVLEGVLADPELLPTMRARERGPDAWARLTDPAAIVESYRSLAAPARGPARPRGRPGEPAPLVSVVVPYFRLDRYVERALATVREQTHPRIEIVVVNDGSFDAADRLLLELASRHPIQVLSQPNSGVGAARNFGIRQSRGRYVLPFDADNELDPTFVETCVRALEADGGVDYVTTWSAFIDEDGELLPSGDGYRPLGTASTLLQSTNLAGDALALFRREVFDRLAYDEELTSYEDWSLYRILARTGRVGHVIPETLFRYRVRGESMLRSVAFVHHDRLLGELAARDRAADVTWCCTNAVHSNR